MICLEISSYKGGPYQAYSSNIDKESVPFNRFNPLQNVHNILLSPVVKVIYII